MTFALDTQYENRHGLLLCVLYAVPGNVGFKFIPEYIEKSQSENNAPPISLDVSLCLYVICDMLAKDRMAQRQIN